MAFAPAFIHNVIYKLYICVPTDDIAIIYIVAHYVGCVILYACAKVCMCVRGGHPLTCTIIIQHQYNAMLI